MVTTMIAITSVAPSSIAEVAAVRGLADHRAQSHGREGLAAKVEVLGDDAGVPGASGGRYETGDQVGKDSRQEQLSPALHPLQAIDVADFFQVGGNGAGPGDDVEQDVPLRAEQQQHDGADPQSAAGANQDQQDDGNKAVAGTEAAICAIGWAMAESLGCSPIKDADRNGPQAGQHERELHAQKGRSGSAKDRRAARTDETRAASRQHLHHRISEPRQRKQRRQCRTIHSDARAPCRRVARCRTALAKCRSSASRTGMHRLPRGQRQQARAAQQIENRRARRLGGFHLLELELLAPGDDGTPDHLVHQHDHRDHDGQAPQDGARVPGIGRGLQVGAQPGKAKVAIAQHEHFAGHQEEPSAGHRHHGIPDQSDGRVGQFQLPEALPPAQAVDLRRFQHFARNVLQRGVEAEGHVPDLAGEDQQNGPELHAQLPGGEQRHHGHHHAGQKTQDGNGLQRVQQRNQEALGLRGCRRRCSRRPE